MYDMICESNNIKEEIIIKQVAFFFGAGAEGFKNFKLPNGIEFMRNSYLNTEIYEKNEKIFKEIFSKNKTNYKYSAHNYADKTTLRAILKKWVFYYFSEENFKGNLTYIHQQQIYSILNKEERKELNDNNKNFFSEPNEDDMAKRKIIDEFQKLIKLSDITTSDKEDIKGTFLNCFINEAEKPKKPGENQKHYFKRDLPSGISFLLDEHFHTIINPQKLGPNNFSKVFNYYWAIFMSIYKPVLNYVDRNSNGKLIQNKIESKDFLNTLRSNLIELYLKDGDVWKTIVKSSKKTYYHSIKDVFLNNSSDIQITGAITSNYYRFIEILDIKKYAYLNGQLKFFEVPETLEIIDITKESFPDNKLFFPFIFGQSYAKPIVNKRQIEAFSCMEEILNDSDILVILGYNINEDDNHINSFIRDFIIEKNRYIIVIGNNDPEIAKKEVAKQLRLEDDSKIIIHEVNYDYTPLIIIQSLKDLIDTL
ncbi:MAG: hypothetical protein GX752_00355 [Clostridium sp.]|nr:hypothetical protein [Clostridium sp.]